MRTLQEKYNATRQGRLAESQFSRDARMELPNMVSKYNGYKEIVSILKNRGMIVESDLPKQEKETATKYPHIKDQFSIESVNRGLTYELEKAGITADSIVTREIRAKAEKKTLANLKKDINHYLHLLAGVKKGKGEDREVEVNIKDLFKDVKIGTIDKKNAMKVVKTTINENRNPELDRLVNGFVKKLADRYEYSLQDAVYAITMVLRSQNYDGINENYRVEYLTKEGEKFKSGVYKTKKEAEDKHWKLAKDNKLKSIRVVKVKEVNENKNPELDRLVNRFVAKLAKRYDYPLQSAVYAIMTVLRSQNYDGINESTGDSSIKAIHFEIDAKKARELKIAFGTAAGEDSETGQIEAANTALISFRKEIGFGNKEEEYVGVFMPGSYAAAISTLGDGVHAKGTTWNQKKYKTWLKSAATNGGSDNATDIAQNATNVPGLVDWLETEYSEDEPLKRVQWDLEGLSEGEVTIEIGDEVEVDSAYGGGRGEVTAKVGSFIVVNGQSHHESDVKLIEETINEAPLTFNKGLADIMVTGYDDGAEAANAFGFKNYENEPDTTAYIKGFIQGIKDNGNMFLEENLDKLKEGKTFANMTPAERKEYGNFADHADIGQFATPEEEWKNHDEDYFYKKGMEIVANDYNGDVAKAYNAVVSTRGTQEREEYLEEASMSDVDAILQDSTNFKDFVKNIFKDEELKSKFTKTKETLEYLKDVYDESKAEGGNLNEDKELEDKAKVYFMQKVTNGEIEKLPNNPKAEYMKLKLSKNLKESRNKYTNKKK